MKILYVTDLHGDKNKYKNLLKIAIDKDIKVIINGGDMLQCDRHKEQPVFINDFYLAMLGNDDLLVLDDLFTKVCDKFDNVCNIDRKKVSINEYEFIGMNYILDHPFGYKDRVVTEKYYIPQQQLSPVTRISNKYGYDKIYNWLEYSITELPYMCDILN